ncbi:MAG: adenosine deaminase [Chloroflexota bacterium]
MDVTAIPKADIHLHLEGAIRPATVVDLARENGLDFPYASAAALEEALAFEDFLQFLAMFQVVNRCLAKPRDFERIARELIEDLATQNVVYAEVRYSPMHPMLRGISFHDVTSAVIEGMRQGASDTGMGLALICGLTRQWDGCLETTKLAVEWAGRGVDAVDIGGDEAGFPADGFVDVYRVAREGGLQLTAHAGEASGPESVWAAVELLGVRRIGHGVRSIEDPRLVEFLRDVGVTLEVCPTSNVKTGVVPDFAHHPLRRLYDAGVRVTLNSDDPAMFQTDVAHEYEVAAREFGFTEPELLQLTRNAIEAGFRRTNKGGTL